VWKKRKEKDTRFRWIESLTCKKLGQNQSNNSSSNNNKQTNKQSNNNNETGHFKRATETEPPNRACRRHLLHWWRHLSAHAIHAPRHLQSTRDPYTWMSAFLSAYTRVSDTAFYRVRLETHQLDLSSSWRTLPVFGFFLFDKVIVQRPYGLLQH